MEKIKEQCESALQLLLKLSNKPNFFYVDEVKEIATIIHTLANSLQSSKGISDEEIFNKADKYSSEKYDKESERTSVITEYQEYGNRSHNFTQGAKWMRSKLSGKQMQGS